MAGSVNLVTFSKAEAHVSFLFAGRLLLPCHWRIIETFSMVWCYGTVQEQENGRESVIYGDVKSSDH